MHTHFGSGTQFLTTGLNVLLFLTFWRLAWFHIPKLFNNNPSVRALAGAAQFQVG